MRSLTDEIERASRSILSFGRVITSRTGIIREIIGMEIRFDLCKLLNESNSTDCPEFVKLINAIEFPVQALRRDLHTRRAIVQLSDLDEGEEKDCLNVVQFLVRDGYLHVVVFARSLDVKRKLRSDVVAVGRAASIVLEELKVKPGLIRFYAGSAHVHV